jgi:hypothetical protein
MAIEMTVEPCPCLPLSKGHAEELESTLRRAFDVSINGGTKLSVTIKKNCGGTRRMKARMLLPPPGRGWA